MKVFLLSVWLICCVFIAPQKVFAHFLAVDNGISAYLHIDPNDDPIAGETAILNFDIHDEQKHFMLATCDCSVFIKENGKTLFSDNLKKHMAKNSIGTGSVSYIFPSATVYTIEVVGKPLQKNSFQPFDLQWDFRINHAVSTQKQKVQTLPLRYGIIFGIILIILLAYCIKRYS